MAFRASAGPREDRPLERFPTFINLRTVVWCVGLPATLLSLGALFRLDLLNVLLLLPSLMFCVSALAGPFLMRQGAAPPMGVLGAVPKLACWLAAALFYSLVSLCAAQGGVLGWAGLALFVTIFGLILTRALRYLPYRFRLRHRRRQLLKLLQAAGVKNPGLQPLADKVFQLATGDVAKLLPELQRAGVPADHQAPLLTWAEKQLRPFLRAPMLDRPQPAAARSRWRSECARSFPLAMLVLLWFFVVPVPGIVVFRAGGYRFTFGFWNILLDVACLAGLVFVADALARLIQWLDLGLGRRTGLAARLQRAFARLRAATQFPGPLPPADLAAAYALCTDAQTYLDQRSYAHVKRVLQTVEEKLDRSAQDQPRSA
jgi:hypothetical protein